MSRKPFGKHLGTKFVYENEISNRISEWLFSIGFTIKLSLNKFRLFLIESILDCLKLKLLKNYYVNYKQFCWSVIWLSFLERYDPKQTFNVFRYHDNNFRYTFTYIISKSVLILLSTNSPRVYGFEISAKFRPSSVFQASEHGIPCWKDKEQAHQSFHGFRQLFRISGFLVDTHT